jgi:hypothetical protein
LDITDPAAEKLFSAAALKIIRRHRADPEDARYCRACGRPVASCDVVALAAVVAASLQTTVSKVRAASRARPEARASTRPSRVRLTDRVAVNGTSPKAATA